jgi:hypothetical protein
VPPLEPEFDEPGFNEYTTDDDDLDEEDAEMHAHFLADAEEEGAADMVMEATEDAEMPAAKAMRRRGTTTTWRVGATSQTRRKRRRSRGPLLSLTDSKEGEGCLRRDEAFEEQWQHIVGISVKRAPMEEGAPHGGRTATAPRGDVRTPGSCIGDVKVVEGI